MRYSHTCSHRCTTNTQLVCVHNSITWSVFGRFSPSTPPSCCSLLVIFLPSASYRIAECHVIKRLYFIVSCLLLQILSIRSVYEQLLRLLPSGEQSELRSMDSFSPFNSVSPLQYNPYTQPLWNAAVAQHQRAMLPAETKVAGKLRQKFRQIGSNSQQVIEVTGLGLSNFINSTIYID